jgi:hypothetical protein
MTQRIPTVQRAFELARTGHYASPVDIRRQLKTEGYHDGADQTSHPSIRKQLRELCNQARAQLQTPAD